MLPVTAVLMSPPYQLQEEGFAAFDISINLHFVPELVRACMCMCSLSMQVGLHAIVHASECEPCNHIPL